MILECEAVCLTCAAVPRTEGATCPDCGTRLSIVPVETFITLSALQTMERRRHQKAEFEASEALRLSLPQRPAN